LDIIHCPSYYKSTTFESWLCICHQVRMDRASLYHCVQWRKLALSRRPNRVGSLPPYFYLVTETEPAFQTFCFWLIWMMGNVQNQTYCNIPSPEPFRFMLNLAWG
jgi:hypothetical protein